MSCSTRLMAFLFCLSAAFASEFQALAPCTLSSLELSQTPEQVQPCILYDEGPSLADSTGSFTVTLVQVTPSSCRDHRDGALTAVRAFNELNMGRGLQVGYQGTAFVNFRLVSVVAGNTLNNLTAYEEAHPKLLRSMLNTSGLDPTFIIGSCSFVSDLDIGPSEEMGRILMAQVGPPAFYSSNRKFTFGIHISSDEYPTPLLQKVSFTTPNSTVNILTRTKSLFFNSTCNAAASKAAMLGLSVKRFVSYDPFGDQDRDGRPNEIDEDFLQSLTDQVCAGPSESPGVLVACIATDEEANTVLARLAENGCKPASVWFTSSTWAWGIRNPKKTEYMTGGGQWHQQFSYSDEFFSSGSQLLQHQKKMFGYAAQYDSVASYTIVYVFAHLLEFYFRGLDAPNVTEKLHDEYEMVRRALLTFTVESIFGRVSFDGFKRNNGRQAAGSQYQPFRDVFVDGEPVQFVDVCVSPQETARANLVYPAPNNVECPPGKFDNLSLLMQQPLLASTCDFCPEDTYSPNLTMSTQCYPCAEGSSTFGRRGQHECVRFEENLIPTGIRATAFALVSVNWFLAATFSLWTYCARKDPVVQISQAHFLWLLCFGTLLSTSTIIPLSSQAGLGESTASNDVACRIAPWIFCAGFTLEYSSLCAKTFRLYRCVHNPMLERVRITTLDALPIVFCALLLDFAVLTVWTLIDPLTWRRSILSSATAEDSSVLVVDSVGTCKSPHSWAYIGSLLSLHFSLLIVTNLLLYKVRKLNSRYQESKYIAVVCISGLQLLLLAIPILVAVGEDPTARFIVLSAVIFLNDFVLLCFTFIPKIYFQRKGLNGMDVIESIKPMTTGELSKTERAQGHQLTRRPSTQDVSLNQLLELSSKLESAKLENCALREQVYQLQQQSTPDVYNHCGKCGRSFEAQPPLAGEKIVKHAPKTSLHELALQ